MIKNKIKGICLLSTFLCSGLLSSCKTIESKDEYSMVMDVLNNTDNKYKELEYFQYEETTTKDRGKTGDNIEVKKSIYKYDSKNKIIYYSSIKDDKIVFESYKTFVDGKYYTINKTDKKYKVFEGHKGEYKWVNEDLYFYLLKSDKAISNHLLLKDKYSEYKCDYKKKGYIKSSGKMKKDDITYNITYKIEDYILTEYKKEKDYGKEGEYGSYFEVEEVNMEFNEEKLTIPSISNYKDVTMEDNVLWS